MTHLYPVLGQIRPQAEHLAGVDVRVVRLLEGRLQLLQLLGREDRPRATTT